MCKNYILFLLTGSWLIYQIYLEDLYFVFTHQKLVVCWLIAEQMPGSAETPYMQEGTPRGPSSRNLKKFVHK